METQSRGSICPFKRNSQWKNRAEWKWETLSRRKCRRWRRRRKFARVQEIPKCQVESGWSIHIWHQQELETKTFSNAQWVVFIYLFYKKKKKKGTVDSSQNNKKGIEERETIGFQKWHTQHKSTVRRNCFRVGSVTCEKKLGKWR